MKILCIYDGSGPKYHRILLPAYGLQEGGAECIVKNDLKEEDVKDIDVLFFNRMIAGWSVQAVLKLRDKYGFKMVCDLDDHWILNKEHILHDSYKAHGISMMIHGYILHSDLVTVTHERLQDEVEEVNPNCHILPNAIPKVAQFDIQKIDDDCIRLFWAGGVTHQKDIDLLRTTMPKIKRDKVKFVMAGYVPGHKEWTKMAKAFTTDSSFNTMVFQSVKVHEYYQAYRHCDIALIPLVDNVFNRHKSNLKILEAANIGAPVVVSRVHPYLDFPDVLVNYVDAENPWFKQITRLINDPELRYEQGAGLQAYCDRFYNFDKISNQRLKLFHDTTEQRETRKVQTEAQGVAE